MQSIRLDVKELYRYYQDGERKPNNGGIVANWVRSSRRYRLNFYPMMNGRTREEFGYSDTVTWRIIANHTTDFKLGDRLGNADSQQYEITAIRTFRDQQQIEAREIWLGR